MKVSIVVPVYNLGHVVHEAIASLTAQTYNNIEIIIVDDGSTDDSGAVVDALATGDKRIRVVHQENMGLPGALNTGFSKASGVAGVILSADDLLAPTFVEATVKAMRRTDADIVSVDMSVGKRHVKTQELNLSTLRSANCFGYAALFKKEWFEKTGGFKETFPDTWEDYEFWLNCAKLGAKGVRVSEPLFIYRPNPDGKDARAQGTESLLQARLEGYHRNVFGLGRGLVTFIVPCYNHEQYVRAAVQSALNQTFPHVNVLVVDDASPGDVSGALAGLGERVFVVRHDENRGLSAARNTGIEAAIQEFHSQYCVFLDADDEVDPRFVDVTLAARKLGACEYVYTDVQLIGGAWHTFEVPDFQCMQLYRKHLHPCTFLFPTVMWQSVISARGYGYDEDMRIGYEDWEFALACVEAGWVGKRVPQYLFKYRNHTNGSMRTRARQHHQQIVRYIQARHPKEVYEAMCTTCSGGSFTTQHTGSSVQVVGIGLLPLGHPVEVVYTGSASGNMTKYGNGKRKYVYSSQKRKLYVPAEDTHLFQGPFTMRTMQMQKPVRAQVEQAPSATPVPTRPTPATSPPPAVSKLPEGVKLAREPVDILRPPTTIDDLVLLPGIGRVRADALKLNGFSTFAAIISSTPVEISAAIGVGYQQAQEIIGAARDQRRR